MLSIIDQISGGKDNLKNIASREENDDAPVKIANMYMI